MPKPIGPNNSIYEHVYGGFTKIYARKYGIRPHDNVK